MGLSVASRWIARAAVFLPLLAAAPAAQSADIHLVTVGSFSSPVYITAPSGDLNRIFIVEQSGRVQLVKDGVTQPTPFLDLHTIITNSGEQGLLSIAFAPDYSTSRHVYAYYINLAGSIQIDEFTAPTSSSDTVDISTRRPLLTIPHPGYSNHNGGQLQFGPDGYLYIGTGDGGGGGDPDENAQNLASRLGKLLRINPTAGSGSPHQVPSDNPFVDGAGPNADEIYAYGLRNPWRFSFDRSTGDLTIGDVGQGDWEEVDFRTRDTGLGANFGWDEFEGTHNYEGGVVPGHIPPVFEYGHGSGDCSLTGGYVVRDPLLPELTGRYVYGDFCVGALRSIVLTAASSSDDRGIGLTVAHVSSFGEDACGHLYVASLNGQVSRLASGSTAGCLPPATPSDPASPAPSIDLPTASGSSGTSAGGTASSATTTRSKDLADTAAPEVKLTKSTREHVLKDRAIRLRLRCSEECVVSARGSVQISSGKPGNRRLVQKLRLSEVRRPLKTNQETSLTIKLSRKTTGSVRKALARRHRVVATVLLTLKDSAGNTRTERTQISISG